MTYPLEEILKEDQEFKWIEECHISFEKLKRKLVKAPILKFPNWSIKFHVHIDASILAIGAILTQPGDDGMDYPIFYSSRKLNKAERNYSTTEREALGTTTFRPKIRRPYCRIFDTFLSHVRHYDFFLSVGRVSSVI